MRPYSGIPQQPTRHGADGLEDEHLLAIGLGRCERKNPVPTKKSWADKLNCPQRHEVKPAPMDIAGMKPAPTRARRQNPRPRRPSIVVARDSHADSSPPRAGGADGFACLTTLGWPEIL